MEIIRISAAGIACVLAAIFMKTAKPEYSVYLYSGVRGGKVQLSV